MENRRTTTMDTLQVRGLGFYSESRQDEHALDYGGYRKYSYSFLWFYLDVYFFFSTFEKYLLKLMQSFNRSKCLNTFHEYILLILYVTLFQQ